MDSYNYTEFASDDYDFDTVNGPAMGGKAPDFKLDTPDGQQNRLLDFEGAFLVLEMGSITCPLFQHRRKVMAHLSDEFPEVTSKIMYVREAHPGADIQSHSSMEEKLSCARRLQNVDKEGRLIVVDSFEGLAHQAYGGMPNAVFIINKNGCVVYRAEWNNPVATRRVLKRLLRGKSVRAESYFRPATPNVVLRTLGAAGKGSAKDFFRGLPSLIWANLVKRNLRVLFGRGGTVKADATC